MPSLRITHSVLPLLCVAALASACGVDEDPLGEVDDETGTGEDEATDEADESGDSESEDQIACEETIQELESLDTPSSAGFTAGDVLDPIAGEFITTLNWMAQEGDVKVDVKPVAAQVELDLTLADIGGALRFIESTPNEAAVAQGLEDELDCRSRFELEVSVKLASDDGTLKEDLPVVLSAELEDDALGVATVHHVIDMDSIEGTLEISEVDPADPDELSVILDASFSVDPDTNMPDSQGSLGGWAEYREGEGEDEVVTRGEFIIATW
ncbi:hypothetical protein G6O69_34510 [Pseudenhygromyxa sp. WMMC2535]|uniref:hypothetical protein n=1 Tax=Pseudenhygromyxa sp. WMMC2535 TaxID=2712867 RepID=UPI001552FF26|nr:hypothetical protein [Pseudenhygromyxa sp. WMMC2535]NVB42986.1 hypothetical protein [Pseudenhygromyxa sp. WMMC2535]